MTKLEVAIYIQDAKVLIEFYDKEFLLFAREFTRKSFINALKRAKTNQKIKSIIYEHVDYEYIIQGIDSDEYCLRDSKRYTIDKEKITLEFI